MSRDSIQRINRTGQSAASGCRSYFRRRESLNVRGFGVVVAVQTSVICALRRVKRAVPLMVRPIVIPFADSVEFSSYVNFEFLNRNFPLPRPVAASPPARNWVRVLIFRPLRSISRRVARVPPLMLSWQLHFSFPSLPCFLAAMLAVAFPGTDSPPEKREAFPLKLPLRSMKFGTFAAVAARIITESGRTATRPLLQMRRREETRIEVCIVFQGWGREAS